MASFDAEKIKQNHDELHSHLPNDSALRVKALESILFEKGIVQAENLDKWVQAYTEEVGPKRGAELVERAWMDLGFKDKLLANAPGVVSELGYHGPGSGHLTVVVSKLEQHARKEEWVEAYLRTPHGQPVQLKTAVKPKTR